MVYTYDDLVREVGQFGRYQMVVYSFPCILSLLTAFQILAPVYFLENVNHRCRLPSTCPWHLNDTFQNWHNGTCRIPTVSQCFQVINGTSKENCTEWVYETERENIITELNLVCMKKGIPTVISTCTFAGCLFGIFFCGMISDGLGRRKGLLLYTALATGSTIGFAFVNSITLIAVFRFLIGFSCCGAFSIAFVLGVEIVGPDVRYHTGIVIEYFWTIGVMALAGIAYLVRSWRTLQLIIALPNALVFLLALFPQLVPESPRWLYSKNKKTDAGVIMKRMMRWNRSGASVDILEKVNSSQQPQKDNNREKHWILEVVRKNPKLILRYGIMCFNWFAIAMVYYGLSMGSGNLPGNIYVTSFLTGAVEFPGYGLAHCTINRFGRKKMHIITMILSGLSLVGLLLVKTLVTVSSVNWLIIALSLLGKMFNTTSFGIVYVWTGELYPTTIRNSGLAISSTFARIGTLIAPFLAGIQAYIPGDSGMIIANLIYASVTLIAGLLSLFVKETHNQQLPESIENIIQEGIASVTDGNRMKINKVAPKLSSMEKPLEQ